MPSFNEFIIHLSATAKILQLDRELKGYRDKLQTTKNAAAKKNLQKRAMDVLKRKRMYENQRDQLAGQQFNIDQVAFGIDSAKATVSTVAAMKAANVELKSTLRNDMNINDIDDLAKNLNGFRNKIKGDFSNKVTEMNKLTEKLL